jgi:hypothetical protein
MVNVNKFFVGTVGLDQGLYIMASPDGATWAPPRRALGDDWRAPLPPALVGSATALTMMAVGLDSSYYVTSSPDGASWSSPTRVFDGWQAGAAPNLCAVDGKLHAALVGLDGQVYVAASADGRSWGAPVGCQGAKTTTPAAIAGFAGSLYLAVVAPDGSLTVASSADGVNWRAPTPIVASWHTDQPLALASFADRLVVAARGRDGNIYVLTSTDGTSWSAPTQVLAGWSGALGLGLAASDRLALSLVGDDGKLYVATSSDGASWSSPTALVTGQWRTSQPLTITSGSLAPPVQPLSGYESRVFTWTMGDVFGEASSGTNQTARLGVGVRWGVLQKVSGFQNHDRVNGIVIMLSPYTINGEGAVTTSVIPAYKPSGQMILNTDYSKYWWLMGCGVQISPDDPSTILVAASPTGTVDMNSVTSSISISAGFFGDQPTANGGFSNSFTTSFPDFSVADLSELEGAALKTLYYMSAYSGGRFKPDGQGPLSWDENLHSDDPKFISQLADQASVTDGGALHLHGPSPNAYQSSLPVLSQGIWMVDRAFVGTTTFTVDFFITSVAWHKNLGGTYAKTDLRRFSLDFFVDWSQVPGQGP